MGGWPEYLRVREERAAAPAATRTPRGETKPGRPASPRREERKRTPPRGPARGAGSLEQQIEAAEAALRSIEDELADPAAWATPEATARSTARHEQARQAVAELYERWEAVAG